MGERDQSLGYSGHPYLIEISSLFPELLLALYGLHVAKDCCKEY
jgi:hypothetical protein